MSWYPRQYPVLEKTEWVLDTPADFRAGTFEGTVLSDQGPQVAPGKPSGIFVTPVIDAGQAVEWRELKWQVELPPEAAVAVRTRTGSTVEECLNARWSAASSSSPARFLPSPSKELYAGVAAARCVQVSMQLTVGTGGSPTISEVRLKAGLVPPALVGPMNQGIVESGRPVFFWTRVEGAAAYELELAPNPEFSGEVYRQRSIHESSLPLPGQIEPGVYFWRVRAIDGARHKSEWSQTRQFAAGIRPKADPSKLQHPYLFFTADDLPEVKRRFLTTHKQTWTKILARAEEALHAPLRDEKDVLLTPGQHSDFHPLAGGVARGQLEPLAMAYLVTGHENYASKARDLMLHLVGFSRWTGVPFGDPNFCYPVWQAALETAGMCKGVATAYDWLYGYLSDDERATIRAGILRLGLLPIVESWSDPRSIRYVPRHQLPAGNWWSVCNSGGGVAALAMLGEVPDAERWVGMIADAIRAYLVYPGGDVWNVDMKAGWGGQYLLKTYPNWGEDGGYIESLGYLDYGLTNALYFIDALKRVTGEDLSPHIHPRLIDQPFYFLCRNPEGEPSTVNFNDSGRGTLSDDLYALLAAHTRSPRAKYLLRKSYPKLKSIHAVLADDDAVEPEQPDTIQGSKLFRDIGWSVFRGGWDDDASLMAAKFHCGRGHQDIGQYVIHYKGLPFVIDPGVVAYSDPVYREHLCTSYAHNLVLVDGQCQLKVDGEVMGFAAEPGSGIVEADLTAAYQDLVSSWTRTLLYLEPETFVVIDRLSSELERSFTWQVHPLGRLAVQPGLGATIHQDRYEMQLKLVSPTDWRVTTRHGFIGSSPADYLAFEPATPSRNVLFVGVFAGAERGRNVGVERRDNGDHLAVRIISPDASHVVLIHKRGEGDMSGWDVQTLARTCAVTVLKTADGPRRRWVMAGIGRLWYDGAWIAEAAAETPYRAG